MGCGISRTKRSISARRLPASTAESPAWPPGGDLCSYSAACHPKSAIHDITYGAINSLSVSPDVRSLSHDSLSQVMECLVDMNQEVVKIILQNRKGIWENKELSDLVYDYLEQTLLILDFCSTLDLRLKRAAHIESIITVALRKFKREHEHENSSVCEQGSVKNYAAATLQELRNLTDPFTEDFFTAFNSIFSRQIVMLGKFQAKIKKLDRKRAKLKIYRRVSKLIFIAASAAVLICSVVAAAVTAPPVVAAAAAAMPLASVWKWVDSIWRKRETGLMEQKEIISSMQIGSYVAVKDLDNIRVQVKRFQIGIEGLLVDAEFTAGRGAGEEAVVVAAVGEMKKGVKQFFKIIGELREGADKCTREITMARALILKRISSQPNRSDEDVDIFS